MKQALQATRKVQIDLAFADCGHLLGLAPLGPHNLHGSFRPENCNTIARSFGYFRQAMQIKKVIIASLLLLSYTIGRG